MAKKKSGGATKSLSRKKPNKKKAVHKTKATAPAKTPKRKKTSGKKVQSAAKKRRSAKPAAKEIRSPERSTLAGRIFSTKRSSRGGRASGAAGQAGDTQGLSPRDIADSESVEELVEEGQAYEADAISGVEDALDPDQGEVHTHEVPEDDVPEEYLDED